MLFKSLGLRGLAVVEVEADLRQRFFKILQLVVELVAVEFCESTRFLR